MREDQSKRLMFNAVDSQHHLRLCHIGLGIVFWVSIQEGSDDILRLISRLEDVSVPSMQDCSLGTESNIQRILS